jgi:hypothetical protein
MEAVLMVALACFHDDETPGPVPYRATPWIDDPAGDAAEYAAIQRDLDRLHYASWTTEEQRLEIARCIAVNEAALARMRGTA